MKNLFVHIFSPIHYILLAVVEGVDMCARPSSVVVSEANLEIQRVSEAVGGSFRLFRGARADRQLNGRITT